MAFSHFMWHLVRTLYSSLNQWETTPCISSCFPHPSSGHREGFVLIVPSPSVAQGYWERPALQSTLHSQGGRRQPLTICNNDNHSGPAPPMLKRVMRVYREINWDLQWCEGRHPWENEGKWSNLNTLLDLRMQRHELQELLERCGSRF